MPNLNNEGVGSPVVSSPKVEPGTIPPVNPHQAMRQQVGGAIENAFGQASQGIGKTTLHLPGSRDLSTTGDVFQRVDTTLARQESLLAKIEADASAVSARRQVAAASPSVMERLTLTLDRAMSSTSQALKGAWERITGGAADSLSSLKGSTSLQLDPTSSLGQHNQALAKALDQARKD